MCACSGELIAAFFFGARHARDYLSGASNLCYILAGRKARTKGCGREKERQTTVVFPPNLAHGAMGVFPSCQSARRLVGARLERWAVFFFVAVLSYAGAGRYKRRAQAFRDCSRNCRKIVVWMVLVGIKLLMKL